MSRIRNTGSRLFSCLDSASCPEHSVSSLGPGHPHPRLIRLQQNPSRPSHAGVRTPLTDSLTADPDPSRSGSNLLQHPK
jgi:hypothetical protein